MSASSPAAAFSLYAGKKKPAVCWISKGFFFMRGSFPGGCSVLTHRRLRMTRSLRMQAHDHDLGPASLARLSRSAKVLEDGVCVARPDRAANVEDQSEGSRRPPRIRAAAHGAVRCPSGVRSHSHKRRDLLAIESAKFRGARPTSEAAGRVAYPRGRSRGARNGCFPVVVRNAATHV